MSIDFFKDRFWPFPVLPRDQQTANHREQLDFLETAFAKGFAPFMFGSENFGASTIHRKGFVLRRGKQHKEVWLDEGTERIIAAHVDGFSCAIKAILDWLEGQSQETVENLLRPNEIPICHETGFRNIRNWYREQQAKRDS
jgi:hypothetical protein